MDKTQLIDEINKLPEFVLRDVATDGIYNKEPADKSENPDAVTYTQEMPSKQWVESEHWKAVTEKTNNLPLTFVTKKYRLVQMKDVFIPLVQNIDQLKGRLIYFLGMAIIDVYPENVNLTIDNDRIGLVAINSVNKQSSVIIKFCIKHNEKTITIPKKLAGFKRVHAGKVFELTQNFITVADKVKDIWKTIITEYTKIKIDSSFAMTVLDTVELKDEFIRKKVTKKLETAADMNLWDLFIYIIELIEEKDYKSELHKRKKLDFISEKMFHYAVISKILNA